MVDKGEYIAMLNVGTNVLFDVEVIWIYVGVKFVFYISTDIMLICFHLCPSIIAVNFLL